MNQYCLDNKILIPKVKQNKYKTHAHKTVRFVEWEPKVPVLVMLLLMEVSWLLWFILMFSLHVVEQLTSASILVDLQSHILGPIISIKLTLSTFCCLKKKV